MADVLSFLSAPAPTWLIVAVAIGLSIENKRLGRAIDALWRRLPKP
jgi:hypothetical protein